MHRLIFVFIDGIGLGAAGDDNPFDVDGLSGFERFSGGRRWTTDTGEISRSERTLFTQLDATLGVSGLPQSGTGQATLFTGVNCAERAGRHYGPFPHSTSLPVLNEHSLFAVIEATAFANAYPDRFLERSRRRNRWSVTTRSCIQAGLSIRTIDDLTRGRAVSADLTRAGLSSVAGVELDVIRESEAAEHLVGLAADHRLTVFEYFHTDKVGHAQDREAADARLASLSAFLDALVDMAANHDITVLVSSDHGNLEDLSVKTHTRNPVPLAVAGPEPGVFASCRSLTDVSPAVRRLLS
ncbi:MAG: peptidase [Rhodothermales bacterium]|nr:peptidase [Rhodothermales bacterium]